MKAPYKQWITVLARCTAMLWMQPPLWHFYPVFLLPNYQPATLFLCSPGESYQKKVPLPQEAGEAVCWLSPRTFSSCMRTVSSVSEEPGTTASTAILLWHSLLLLLHRNISVNRLFLLTTHCFFFACSTEQFLRHKRGYKTTAGLFYRKENWGTQSRLFFFFF